MSNITEIINELIQKVLPEVNKQLPEEIRKDGYDPIPNLVSGSKTLGSINLGICHAKVGVSYKVGDMCGLSSILIEKFTVESVSGDLKSFSANMDVAIEFRSDLSVRAGGGVKAGCGFIHKTVGLSGKGEVNGLSAKGSAVLHGGFNIESGEAVLQEIDFTNLKLHYSGASVSIDGLGIFNEFLKPIENLITGLLESLIVGKISDIVKDEVNHEFHNLLPITVKIPIPVS